MPRSPEGIYPKERILETLINIFKNDADFSDPEKGLLYLVEDKSLALSEGVPINFESAIFSDQFFHIAIYHVTESEIEARNSGRDDTYKFYIDVAFKDSELGNAIKEVSRLCDDIIYTLELNPHLDFHGMLMPKKTIEPSGTLPSERLWLFCSTISITIRTNTISR